MKNLQKGFIVPVLLVVVAFLLVGGGTYVYTQQQTNEAIGNQTAQTTQPTTPVPFTSSTNNTGNDVAQCPINTFSINDSPPVITSITPSSGPVGTTIEIQGCNFLGFEGDKEIWFTNSRGEKGFLNGQMDEATRSSNTVARVTLQQELCKINSYSGLDCPLLKLVPGVYMVYSNSYGGKSNTVNFTVTN
jgi:hypothetical protein